MQNLKVHWFYLADLPFSSSWNDYQFQVLHYEPHFIYKSQILKPMQFFLHPWILNLGFSDWTSPYQAIILPMYNFLLPSVISFQSQMLFVPQAYWRLVPISDSMNTSTKRVKKAIFHINMVGSHPAVYNNIPWRNNPWGSRPTERPPPVSEASANFDR
jgi:hypothetical protein